MKKNSLPLKTKLGYGVGDLGGNMFFTVVGFWLMNYLTDEVGLAPFFAGVALWIGKAFDAVVDPYVGFLSDKTKTRWGRRRPWFLFASIPLAVSFLFMFTNPSHIAGYQIQSQPALFVWATVLYILICLTATMINIPYNALSAELTKDYHEKTVLNGYRMMFAVVGTLIGAGAAMPIVSSASERASGYMMMGGIFGLIMAMAALIPFFALREPDSTPVAEEHHLLKSYFQAFKNKPFVLILIPWTLNIIGITIVQGALIYYFQYVLNNKDLMIPALLIMLITAMIFIPIAVKISNRVGKKETYIGGMTIMSISILFVFLIGHLINPNMIFIFMFFVGAGFSTHYVMPWAIIPDTIEYDYLNRGVRQEGVYYGLWTFTVKLGQAFALLLTGFILYAFKYAKPDHFKDGLGVLHTITYSQSDLSMLGIRLLIGPLTLIFFIAANIILAFYPIDKKKYEEIQSQIRAKEGK